MVEVTSKREEKRGTIAWGYQWKSPKYKEFIRIIKLTEKTSTIPGSEVYWNVHVRYYSRKKYKAENSHFSFIGSFNDKYEAYTKIRTLIRERGNGTEKQWLKFKELRK
jgi:hypothetical protein